MNKEMQTSRYRTGTKIASVFLSAAMLATSFVGLGSVLTAPAAEVAAAGDYNLADSIQQGNILHCFDWTFNDIKAELPSIAEAGFTSIQTSPIQGQSDPGAWYWLYQPTHLSLQANALGGRDELASLCTEAHKYGIKIIVDVVANHLAGDHSKIDQSLVGSEYWHNSGLNSDDDNVDWTNRWQITHCDLGMPDFNSEHPEIQRRALAYVNDLKSIGVDGIRWDAAKHIGLPSEDCAFWSEVAKSGLWMYGEILDGPLSFNENDSGQVNNAVRLMKEYTQYIGITDSKYGDVCTGAYNGGSVPDGYGVWSAKGIDDKKLVYWAESHDTYSNKWGWTKKVNQNVIDRSYATVACRNNTPALYLSRPFATEENDIKGGQKGSTHFTSNEVAAVNRFKNAMSGKADYYTTSNGCAVITRKGGGAVIVKGSGSGSVTVENGGSYATPGTYKDAVSGNTFTITSSTISGQIGDSGIAVIYNADDVHPDEVTVSATPGDSSFTTSVTATLNVTNASSGTYSTSDGKSGTYTNGQTITFGTDVKKGGKVTLTLNATGTNGSATQTYTYTKTDPSATVKIYFDNKSYNWSNVYAYVYDESSGTVKSMAWPGVKLTDKSKSGYFVLDVDAYKTNGQVIFNDGTGSASNRYPAYMQPGIKIAGASKLFGANHSWTDFSDDEEEEPEPEVPTVTSNKASGTTFTSETLDITLTLANASSGTYSVDGGPTKTFTGSKTVTIGEGKIGDSVVTVATTAKGTDGTTKSYTFTYNKKYQVKTSSSSAGTLTSYYSTNKAGKGAKKTITVDGEISDWDSSMIIAQGTANDDPRVYRKNSMYEVGLDLYTLYGAYDDTNLYLMWEMTNVQDVVAPNDDYPLTQGTIYMNMNIPFFIALDTGKSDTIGNKGQTAAGGTLWGSGITFGQKLNKIIAVSTNGANGPYVYGGTSAGLNPVEEFKPAASGIVFKYGKGILSKNVYGIDGAYGANNNRVVGDMCNASAAWVDFNTKGHKSASMDFHYEMSIPLATLGISSSDVASKGVGVLLIMTSGKSGMDCLPYDLSMNDQADLDDSAGSQENNSFEKSDEDYITTGFARIGNGDSGNVNPDDPDDPTTPLQVNFGTDKSAPQLTTTSLTIKGIGIGGTAPYKYQFSVDGTVVKSSSTTDTYTWKPGTAKQHTLKCVITDSTGATATVTKTFTAEGDDIDDPTPDLANNSTVSATSIALGKTVTLTGKASGGKAPYYYALQYKKSSSSSWSTIGTKYDTVNSGTFKPGSAVNYDVRVTVKDAAGKTAAKSWTVKVTNSTPLTNNSTVSATSIDLGKTVTLTGKASGGTSPYYYALQYKKSTASSWTTIGTKYSTTNTGSFKPGSAVNYDVRVTVKDKNGKTAAKSWTLKVNPATTTALENKSTVSATSFKVGDKITIKGSASGGTSPYKYAYYYKKSTATSWSVAGTEFGTATSATISPKSAVTYMIRIDVMDSKGTVVSKTYAILNK